MDSVHQNQGMATNKAYKAPAVLAFTGPGYYVVHSDLINPSHSTTRTYVHTFTVSALYDPATCHCVVLCQ